MDARFVFLACFLVLGCATGEKVQFEQCSEEEVKCQVQDVRIDPCKEASVNAPCKIKRGKSATISFDFVPNFSGSKITARAYKAGSISDAPLLGMDTNACNYSQCPMQQGIKNTYSYNLQILKSFPLATYEVKYKLWNEDNEMCCFTTNIKLVK